MNNRIDAIYEMCIRDSLKIVRYSDVLLGLVVLRTKAQNGFCPMCTKGLSLIHI